MVGNNNQGFKLLQ